MRGFDIDHGTDIQITVDGMPVNMVSHAHGQGYADLHFLIPELIERVDFNKGPYQADKGNFNTAGYINFSTKRRINDIHLKTELGDFGTRRFLALVPVVNSENTNIYFAAENYEFDGPFESPQGLIRQNFHGSGYFKLDSGDVLETIVSHFNSNWSASGQIPVRAVESGLISEFGAIDDTEGGETSRTNVNLKYSKYLSNSKNWINQIYYSKYAFELYSNFTFFLNDPDFGDQIKQKEERHIVGLNSTFLSHSTWLDQDVDWRIGVGLRQDMVNDVELSRTFTKTNVLSRLAFGDVNETNASLFSDVEMVKNNWRVNLGVRFDAFRYAYDDFLAEAKKDKISSIVSPKLNLSYQFNSKFQSYLKLGSGFHSNDSRVSVNRNNDVLPRAWGADLGLNIRPMKSVYFNMAAWWLGLDQEFVYVGDEAVIEPSGKSRRFGLDLSARHQINSWLSYSADLTITKARFVDELEGEDLVPLAPKETGLIGLFVGKKSGLRVSTEWRYLGDRPANEDNSIVAEGYNIMDLSLSYPWNRFHLGIQVQNVFDQSWKETQFATESRLLTESQSTEEIHFTPGNPRFFKFSLEVKI